MTRETKVGMAVACSFLGLVAAVVVLRMGNPDDAVPAPATPGHVARVSPLPPGGAGSGPVSGKSSASEPSVLSAVFTQTGDSLPIPDSKQQAPTGKEAAAIAPPPATPGTVPLPPPPVSEPPFPPVTPPPAVVTPAPTAPASVPPGLPGFPERQGAATAGTQKASTVSPVVPGPAEPGLPALPPAVPENAAASAAPNNKLSPEEEQRKKVEELKTQVAALAQQDAQAAKTAAPTPAIPAPVMPPPSTPAKGPLAQANDLLVSPPLPGPATVPLPAAPPTSAAPPPPVPVLPAPFPVAKDEKAVLPPASKAPDIALKGPLGSMDAPPGPGRLPAPLGTSAGTAVAMGSVPLPPTPLGAPPGGSSTPIAVPMPPTAAASGVAPKVQSFDVETHNCKPGETTFAELSKQLYGSEKYAQALQQFNREYGRTDKLDDSQTRLQPGQPVFVPPVHILELPRYAAAPRETTPIASTAAPSPLVSPPAPIPPPASPAPAANNNPPPAMVASAAGTRTYTVRANGEMLFEIARQTLGDGRRWSEIYRLNPEIHPELAIPGGTQLHLPADARVGS